jgi:hypothetical protein
MEMVDLAGTWPVQGKPPLAAPQSPVVTKTILEKPPHSPKATASLPGEPFSRGIFYYGSDSFRDGAGSWGASPGRGGGAPRAGGVSLRSGKNIIFNTYSEYRDEILIIITPNTSGFPPGLRSGKRRHTRMAASDRGLWSKEAQAENC